ncbi:MAG: GYD domain-containing protein, partial [Dehalococcoidia bacterium]|nr:GYD domain-containing protein [Dehalococcoidia bacterium]
MPHYLFQASYTPESWAAMVRDPQDRSAAIRPLIE